MDSRIYYADGSTYSGLPEGAPTDLVICIAVPPRDPRPTDPPGTFYRWTLVHQNDMYLYLDPDDAWRFRGWYGLDKYEDLKRHLKMANLARGEVRAVLDGVQVRREAFDSIILRAEREHGMTRR